MKKIVERAFTHPATVIYLYGSMGSGKSDFACLLTEWALSMDFFDKIFTFHLHITDDRVPTTIKTEYKETMEDIEESSDSILLIWDEAHKDLHARRGMSKQSVDITEFIHTIRHKDIKVLFISQRYMDVDTIARDLADIYFRKELRYIGNGRHSQKFGEVLFDYPPRAHYDLTPVPATRINYSQKVPPLHFPEKEKNNKDEKIQKQKRTIQVLTKKLWERGYSLADMGRKTPFSDGFFSKIKNAAKIEVA